MSYGGGGNRWPHLTRIKSNDVRPGRRSSIDNAVTDLIFGLPASGGTSLPVGLATESDAAFALAAQQTRAVGLSQESDTALARTAAQARAVGIASEQDSAFARSATQARTVGLSQEQDQAFALLQGGTSFAVGLASENDTALALGIGLGVGLASESDSAFARAATQSRGVGLSAETDAALSRSATQSRAVGLAQEQDTAFALPQSGAVSLPVGPALEIDTAFALGSIVANPALIQVFAGGGGQAFPDRQPRKEPKPRKLFVGRKAEPEQQTVSPPVVMPVGLACEFDEALALPALLTQNGLMRTKLAPRLMRTSM